MNAIQPVSQVGELSGLYILSCYQRHVDETWYVSHTPGQGGRDWGWAKTLAGATPMPPYWVRRFRADMRSVGRTGVASLV